MRHSSLLAFVASAMVLAVDASPNGRPDGMQMRALIGLDTSASAPTDTNTAVQTPTQTSTTPTSTSTSSTTSSTPSTSATSKTDSPTSEGGSSATSASPAQSSTSQAPVTSAVATTNAAGQTFTSFIEVTASAPSNTPSPSQTSNDTSGDSGGLSTGSIVGLSVSGGIAAIGIILFFVWKFTRKRFSDFDDNEAIKWPELNAHNNDVHALPTHATGMAGFGPENESDVNLTRAPSPGAYANSIGASSIPEGHVGDPYAVPPLPHLNPNQPYRDEPGVYGAGFYDPYRGPVPNTFSDDTHGSEAIPMTQMARMRSPAPQAVYDMQGRGSPAPQAVTGYPSMEERSRTPNPGLATGRDSPGPHSGYGYGSR